MPRKVEKTDEFIVETDEGEQFQIIEYTHISPSGKFGDPNRVVPGQRTLLTSKGQHVNYQDDGTYKIVEVGKIAKKNILNR